MLTASHVSSHRLVQHILDNCRYVRELVPDIRAETQEIVQLLANLQTLIFCPLDVSQDDVNIEKSS